MTGSGGSLVGGAAVLALVVMMITPVLKTGNGPRRWQNYGAAIAEGRSWW